MLMFMVVLILMRIVELMLLLRFLFQTHQMALIIPFRNRSEQLSIFVRHMHPMLKRQNLDYRIFVVEQVYFIRDFGSPGRTRATHFRIHLRIRNPGLCLCPSSNKINQPINQPTNHPSIHQSINQLNIEKSVTFLYVNYSARLSAILNQLAN